MTTNHHLKILVEREMIRGQFLVKYPCSSGQVYSWPFLAGPITGQLRWHWRDDQWGDSFSPKEVSRNMSSGC